MRKLFSLVLILMSSNYLLAQAKLPTLDKSPMDMSYFPNGFPLLKIQDRVTEPPSIRLIYSRPQLNGRKAFGELRELGVIWRLGANEATEIEFFKEVRMGDKRVKKGRYTLYCIPYADKWTMIVNRETDTWGDFKYDAAKDVVRFDVPVTKALDNTEALTMFFENMPGGASLLIYWDDVRVAVPVFIK